MSYKWKSIGLVGRTSRQTILFPIKRSGGRGGEGGKEEEEKGIGSTGTCLLPFNLSNWNVLINGMSEHEKASHGLNEPNLEKGLNWTPISTLCFVEINSYLIMLLWSTWSWKPILTHGTIVPLCVILSFFKLLFCDCLSLKPFLSHSDKLWTICVIVMPLYKAESRQHAIKKNGNDLLFTAEIPFPNQEEITKSDVEIHKLTQ